MPRLAFEDFTPGTVTRYGGVTVDRDELVAFAREYDPEPFHLGEESARGTFVGELTAPGWFVCGLQMRMLCDAVLLDSTGLGAPGIEELAWRAPVRPGERLFVTQTILDAKASRSRPEIGLVRFRLDLHDEAGEAKMQQTNWIIFAARAAAGQVTAQKAAIPGPSAKPVGEAAPARSFYTLGADALAPGMSVDLGGFTFTPERILAFAKAFDPQPFHLDEEAARKSLFGSLSASGWHTGSAGCKVTMARREADCDAARAEGLPVPQFGPSPGFRDLKWLRPVLAGDTIAYRSTIVESRPSRSRPGWSLVTHEDAGVNQNGETVFSLRGTVFWSRAPVLVAGP